MADLGGLTASNVVSITVSEPVTAWRQFHFETTENSGSAADGEDPDGDGRTNAREYVMGTVPSQADAGSPLVAASAEGDFTLSFVARPADGAGYAGMTRRYTVESNTDPAHPALWESLPGYSGIVGENQTVTLTAPPGMRVKLRGNVPHAWLKEGRNVFAHAHEETMVSADALVIGSPWTRRTCSAAPWSGHRPRLWKLPALT